MKLFKLKVYNIKFENYPIKSGVNRLRDNVDLGLVIEIDSGGKWRSEEEVVSFSIRVVKVNE